MKTKVNERKTILYSMQQWPWPSDLICAVRTSNLRRWKAVGEMELVIARGLFLADIDLWPTNSMLHLLNKRYYPAVGGTGLKLLLINQLIVIAN